MRIFEYILLWEIYGCWLLCAAFPSYICDWKACAKNELCVFVIMAFLLYYCTMENEAQLGLSGRGRGRGRGGGVPLLPSGLWNELKSDSTEPDPSEPVAKKSDDIASDNFKTMDSMQMMSFGGGGRGRGRGRGRGDGRGGRSGPGFEKDAKGPDWECPGCSNVNWSWRSNCNRCQTAKPGAPVVCVQYMITDASYLYLSDRRRERCVGSGARVSIHSRDCRGWLR
jgi:hypothetical protein